MDLSTRENIQAILSTVDTILEQNGMFLYLQLVGGSALIMNGMTSYETQDMDTIVHIEQDIKDLLDDLYVDINDDANTYACNYEGRTFIHEDEMSFSNIEIEYLDLPDTLLTKMQNIDDDWKMQGTGLVLYEDLGLELDVEQIVDYFDYEFGYACSPDEIQIIQDFIDNCPPIEEA